MPDATARAVLYVEDDRINTILMEEVFRRLPGWTLECAEDGTQALALLQTLSPDLLLIDMNLPDMCGLELLRRLRSDPRLAGHAHMPCIALSADDRREDIEAARRAGFADYWVKPIDVPRLTSALQEVLLIATAQTQKSPV